MAKEKLFTPEDFDKPKDKSFWQNNKGIIIGITALLIVVAIVLCCIFCGKNGQPENILEKEQTVQIQETHEAVDTTVESEDIEAESSKETNEGANVDSEITTNQASVEETLRPISQHINVSSDIEQEAMKVIRGDYGNIPERREKLGSRYQEIQDRVNQLKKEGVF